LPVTQSFALPLHPSELGDGAASLAHWEMLAGAAPTGGKVGAGVAWARSIAASSDNAVLAFASALPVIPSTSMHRSHPTLARAAGARLLGRQVMPCRTL
jgi:hypothetical protein